VGAVERPLDPVGEELALFDARLRLPLRRHLARLELVPEPLPRLAGSGDRGLVLEQREVEVRLFLRRAVTGGAVLREERPNVGLVRDGPDDRNLARFRAD